MAQESGHSNGLLISTTITKIKTVFIPALKYYSLMLSMYCDTISFCKIVLASIIAAGVVFLFSLSYCKISGNIFDTLDITLYSHLMLLAANFRPYHPLGAHFRGNNHYIRAPIYSCLQDLQIEKGEISFSVPFASGPGSSKPTHEHLRLYNK